MNRSRNPGNAQAWFLLGVAYHQTGQPEALLSLKCAISIEPRHLPPMPGLNLNFTSHDGSCVSTVIHG
ncbi:MAG TPA: tetratricopeptide repeat protein [Sulfuricella sp.]|nr:tetratricopeptide repeat protein [Sulfuricella sp.]